MGWVANAVTLGGVALAVLALFRSKLRDWIGTTSFAALAGKRFRRGWTDQDRRAIADIAIVDDDPGDFPISELKADGLRVKAFKQVRLNDLGPLAEYDIVFLDMHGVVRDDVTEGGLRLIGRLLEANPRQRICAVSSKTFDPTAMSFFRQAHDVKRKPMTAQACSDVIGVFLREKLDPVRLALHLDSVTSHLTRSTRKALIAQTEQFAASARKASEFNLPRFGDATWHRDLECGLRDLLRMLRRAVG
jgi:hypothetical protein